MSPTRRSPSPAIPPSRSNHVFVDFENVPSVDLSRIGDSPTQVTLLIGEKQRRLDLELVRQIHQHAAKVKLIEVGASGRNALDMVLAWHLGRTAAEHPQDTFFVVSKDKDYNPLIGHLQANGYDVQRVDAFRDLPCLAARQPTPTEHARPSAEPRPARRRRDAAGGAPVPSPTPPAALPSPAARDRFDKLVDRLRNRTKSRPARRRTLESHINAFFGHELPAADVEGIITALEERRVVAIDPQGRVAYTG